MPIGLQPRKMAVAFVLSLLGLSACGASESVEPTGSASATQQTGGLTASAEGKTQYPLTVSNCGVEVTFEQAPKRVVSLDQGTTEILLLLGLHDRMVGTASWTDPVLEKVAAANETVPRLADNAPTYEVVLDADPDFVTASFGRHYKAEGGVATRERFAETGISSYLSPTDCEGSMSINGGGTRTKPLVVEQIYEDVLTLAEIFDVTSRGEQLVAELKERVKAVQDKIGDPQHHSVAFWFADTKTPYFAGGYGAAAILTELSGMTNVYAGEADDWISGTWEDLVDKDPQILVLGDLSRNRLPGDNINDKYEFLSGDPLAKTLEAVRTERYIPLHGAELNPSIRFVDGLEKIADYLAQQ